MSCSSHSTTHFTRPCRRFRIAIVAKPPKSVFNCPWHSPIDIYQFHSASSVSPSSTTHSVWQLQDHIKHTTIKTRHNMHVQLITTALFTLLIPALAVPVEKKREDKPKECPKDTDPFKFTDQSQICLLKGQVCIDAYADFTSKAKSSVIAPTKAFASISPATVVSGDSYHRSSSKERRRWMTASLSTQKWLVWDVEKMTVHRKSTIGLITGKRDCGRGISFGDISLRTIRSSRIDASIQWSGGVMELLQSPTKVPKRLRPVSSRCVCSRLKHLTGPPEQEKLRGVLVLMVY